MQPLARLHWIFIAFLVLISLAGCNPTIESSESFLSEHEAIDAALKIASSSRPEISGAQVPPFNIAARQMTLEEAVKQINPENAVAVGYDPNMRVWFVTMEGIWTDEFPRPDDFPTPLPYHHYVAILDAKTGVEIEISVSP